MNIRSLRKRVLFVVGMFIVFNIHNPFFAFDIFYKPAEPLGPSSRNTAIVISEIMYNYGYRPDGKIIEYIELYNSNPYPEDISGYKITGLINYTFPSNTVIGSRQFLVLAKSAADVQSVYGLTGVLSYGGNQSISGTGTIQLRDGQNKILLNIKFSNKAPWPESADGTYHSLVLARPSYGENDYRAWTISDYRGGSPGRQDTFATSIISPVVINEICANPSTGERFIEIYNRSGSSVNISDYVLTDDPVKMKYKIPRTIYIPPYGRYGLPASGIGFSPGAMGETIYLISPSGQRVFDAVKYDPHPSGVSWGRYPDGAEEISLLKISTQGATNSPIYKSDIVINEIMYAPISGDSDDEYIELYNRGTNSVNLGGWELQGGINFYFRSNTVIQPGQYLVVARNMTNLFEKYNRSDKLCCGKMVGNYIGSLNDDGERIALSMPFTVTTIDDQTGAPKINYVTVPVDEIVYGTDGDWGKWSRGGGSSLEIVNPDSNGRFAINWKDSDESNKAQWKWDVTSLELQGGKGNSDRLQIFLRDKGECLLDDVEVEVILSPNNVNLLINSSFETGLNGWHLNGNHSNSRLSQNGYQGTKCLHLKSEGAGDILQNNITTFLDRTLDSNSMVTISARVRWLAGNTNLVLRLGGNYAEFRVGINSGILHGTPNEQNSAFIGYTVPGIKEVSHSPSIPAPSNSVLITAKVEDPDGLSNVSLYYKIDPSTNYSTIVMKDDGTGGDKYANDGIYSALIPGQSQGTLVAFKIIATDASSNKVISIYPLPENSYECLVRFGDANLTNSAFGSYRVWMTDENMNIFTNQNPLSKLNIPVTFVYNNRIIYGARISYAGDIEFQTNSSPVVNKYRYSITFPEDNKFIGTTSIEKILTTTNTLTDDTTIIRNLTANILARIVGQPYFNVRLIRFYINGEAQGELSADCQTITSDYCSSLFDLSNIELLSASPWLEYSGDYITNYGWADFNKRYNRYGEQDLREYEVNWKLLMPLVYPDGYNNFIILVSLLNEKTFYNYEVILNDYIYIDQWTRTFAFQHFIGNQDFFTKIRSCNAYLVLDNGEKWVLLPGGYENSINSTNISAGDDLFDYNTNDVGISNLLSTDYVSRLYKQELSYLVRYFYNSNQFGTIINSLDTIFKNENITISSPYLVSDWLDANKNYISQQLSSISNITFNVNLPSFLTTNTYCIAIDGCAPLDMEMLEVNSNLYTIKWLTLTNWSIMYPLNQGTNTIYIQALDKSGNKITNASFQSKIVTPQISTITNFDNVYFMWNKYFSSNYTSLNIIHPVVINEIMYNSLGAGGDYVELFNPNTNIFVDLSKWIFDGISYEFPDGTTLGPLEYLVVVNDIGVFKSLYSSNVTIIGQYKGNLNNFGEILQLVIPGRIYSENIIVDSVSYEPIAPWPTNANGVGASLQLINPFEDNSRVGNWSAVYYNINSNMLIATPGFANSVLDYQSYIPKVWINEIQVENQTGITNSFGVRSPWIELLYNGDNNIVLTNYYISDNYEDLLKYNIPDGTELNSMQPLIIFADGNTNYIPTELHLNFILNTNSGVIYLSRIVNNSVQVVDYIRYNVIPPNCSYGSYPDGQCIERQVFLEPTPGLPNSTEVKVFINEWMASNIACYEDKSDNDFEDWIELYNMSYNPVDISGYYLTDNLTNKTLFRIQEGTIIPARGFLIIWADKEEWQNYPGAYELHAKFSLSKSGDTIGLFSPNLAPVDIVTFGTQIDNVSQGRFPDGGTNIYFMNMFTPGLPNLIDAVVSKVEPIRISPGGIAFILFQVSNVPLNLLRFDAGPGMPPDAYLDKDRGIFVWSAPSGQFSGITNFSIKICDLRPGGSTINVDITIMIINLNVSIGKLNNFVSLTWNSTTQQAYRIQYKDDLNSLEWLSLESLINATSSPTTILIPMTNQHRFFRVIEQ